MRYVGHLSSCILLGLLLLGCSDAKIERTTNEDPYSDKEVAAPSSLTGVFMARDVGGAMVFRDGAFTSAPGLVSLERGLKSPGGGFYTFTPSLALFDGQQRVDIGASEEKVNVPTSITKEGHLVATGRTTVGVYDGKHWKKWDLAEINSELLKLDDAVMAPDSTLYVCANGFLFVHPSKGEWQSAKIPFDLKYCELGVGDDGVVLLHATSKNYSKKNSIFTFRENTFTKVASTNIHKMVLAGGVVHALTLDGKKLLHLVGGELKTRLQHPGALRQLQVGADSMLYALDAKERQVVRIDEEQVTLLPSKSRALPFALDALSDNYDVDATGRVWLRSAYGLHVIEGDEVLSLLPKAEGPLLHTFDRVLVLGDGPAERPNFESTGFVASSGLVVDTSGAPVPNILIEACDVRISKDYRYSDQTFRGKSPCAKSDNKFGSTRTNAKGRFSFSNMPRVGNIGFVYQEGKDWNIFLKKNGLKSCYETPDNAVCDIGSIKLSKP